MQTSLNSRHYTDNRHSRQDYRVDIETAQTTRRGDRDNNQDRMCVLVSDDDVLLAVADGMGGHADGEVAAQTAVEVFAQAFKQDRPAPDDQADWLTHQVREAHRAVERLGRNRPYQERPRTTCTLCVVSQGIARWAHVGDSRVYVFRQGALLARTRDHSAVETLFREGMISEEEMLAHPLRNLVEQCLGGERTPPQPDISEALPLTTGDIVVLCSDGFWAPLDIAALGEVLHGAGDLELALEGVAEEAESAQAPYSDNVTAVACRLLSETDAAEADD